MAKKIHTGVITLLALGLVVTSVATATPRRRRNPDPPPPATQPAQPADPDRRDPAIQDMTGWTKLGERWVDGNLDRDSIVVGVVEGTFRRVMLKVEHSRLDLLDVTFRFGDGSMFSPGTRLSFAPGTTSRIIDLPGAARVIRRAEFRYANLPGGGRAQVELWAR
jgi:hypothetical protein